MEVRAIARQQRISPLKAREVAREIQGLSASRALDLLNFVPKKAATLIGKTLKSAIVTEARHLARITQRAKGSASAIKRRSSHITIVLSDEIPLPQPKQKGAGRKPAA